MTSFLPAFLSRPRPTFKQRAGLASRWAEADARAQREHQGLADLHDREADRLESVLTRSGISRAEYDAVLNGYTPPSPAPMEFLD